METALLQTCEHFESLVIEEDIIVASCFGVAANTTSARAFGDFPGEGLAFIVFQNFSGGAKLHPKPVLVVVVIALFSLVHDGHSFQPFLPVGMHFVDTHTVTAVVSFHVDFAISIVEINGGQSHHPFQQTADPLLPGGDLP